MENNSDKELRDKLAGAEFPFDPQAWENMEAMLDEKKKRRGFFWWWTGGIAAALLFAVVGYEVGRNYQLQSAKYEVNTKETTDQRHQTAVNTERQETENQESEANTKTQSPNENSANTSNSSLNYNTENVSKPQTLGTTPNLANPSNPRQPLTNVFPKSDKTSSPGGEALSYSHEQTATSSYKISSRQKRKQAGLEKQKAAAPNTNVVPFQQNPFAQQTEMLASATTKSSLSERIEMDKRTGLLESTDEEYTFSKKSEEALPKMKKKNFNYSLGALVNITGTMVSDFGFRKFYSQPSFAAGVTHEFLFINRIAITNSILYSQTGFKVKEPVAPVDSPSITVSYSSAIRELQIPIGIKAYPVTKKWFRFSISAGIINHIKLKEAFTIEKYTQTPPNNIVNFDNTFVATSDNPFLEGLNKNITVQGVQQNPGEQAEYFGMGGLRRYYASFYASAGIEFIAKRKFIFFTEPMFYMSLNKIGLQEKRKYNVGVSGGFRYQF